MNSRAARMASARMRRIDGLARRANPQMAVVEQEIDAVLFELNRIGLGFRDALHDFDVRDADFEAAGRARLGANLAGDDDARFLRQPAQRFEGLRLLLLRDDALHHARCRREKWGRAACPIRAGCRASRAA